MRSWLAVALIGGLAGCGAETGGARHDDAGALARALAGRTPGPAERCIPASRLGGVEIVGPTLLYRDGATIWRSDVADCPSLSGDPVLIVDVFGDQYCQNDHFRTLPRGGASIPGPICRFGPFTPYRRPR